MKKEILKTQINGIELFVNELENSGWENVNGDTYEVFIDNNFAFYFTTIESFEKHVTNNGDGDVEFTTKVTELDELAFYVFADESPCIENMKTLDYKTSETITKICNQKYYNVVEL